MCAFFDLVIPLLGIYPRVIFTRIHKDKCVKMYPTALNSIENNKISIKMDAVQRTIDTYL